MAKVRVVTGQELQAVGEARAIASAAERADARPPVSDQAFLAVGQGERELVLFDRADAGVDSPVIAFGIIGAGELDLVVTPESRNQGVGAAALAELLSRRETAGESANDTPLLAWSHGENPAADALLEHAGFTPVRSLFRMSLDQSLLPGTAADPFTVALPDGFTLRRFDEAAPDDASAWVRVNAAAFATHPEQGRITEADFALMREEPWFDANDLFLLEEAGNLAGYTWVKTVRDDSTTLGQAPATELYAIGIEPAYAGRGLGSALLRVTLARMAQHQPSQVDLYVDGENARAVTMYENAGFTISSRSRQWALRTAAQ